MNEKIDILAFGAHPDDVELGCGGTLVKMKSLGYRTGIIDLTEGEMGSRGTVEQRYTEADAAAKVLQVDHRENMQMPDGKIQVNEKNKEKIVRIIRALKPSLIFAPYPDDRHPDHVHTGNLISEAWFNAGVRKFLPDLPPHRPYRVIYYMSKYEFEPSFMIDISNEFEKKTEALKTYHSQFFNPEWPEKQTFISSKWFMESVEFRARHFGWMAGVKYAEPFWIREHMAIDDPMPIFSRSIL